MISEALIKTWAGVSSSCGARGGFLPRHDEDLREPLVRRPPPPDKDLESPSSTRLEALVPSRDSRARTRSPSSGKSIGVGCHFLLQGIFPIQGSNLGLPHCMQTLYHLSHQGNPRLCLCLTKSSACGRLWQFAHPRPLPRGCSGLGEPRPALPSF